MINLPCRVNGYAGLKACRFGRISDEQPAYRRPDAAGETLPCYTCAMIEITPFIQIDEQELEYNFLRAGGPGGQNINKVSSAVQLRF
ncbi:MAG: peptide chain release factor-like protein, partial [Acidobacteriaceae bacterium]